MHAKIVIKKESKSAHWMMFLALAESVAQSRPKLTHTCEEIGVQVLIRNESPAEAEESLR